MNTYSVSEFAKEVGITVKTLQRWDRQGKLVPLRTPTNRRLYTQAQLLQVRGGKVNQVRQTVVYCRVSSPAQKADLANQKQLLEQFCAARGLVINAWIEEIGGGLNFKRPKFLKIVDQIVAGKVVTLVIAHKDRLTRFGFDLLAHLCEQNDCELIVMNTETLSPEREMVEDLMTIVDCFSSRLYGLRNYKKSLAKALDHDKSPQNTPQSE